MDDFYRVLLDSLHEGVYFLDEERRISYWNKGAERITGFSADEVMGTRCRDNILMHVDSEGIAICEAGCPVGKTIEDGQPREVDVYLHHKNGYRLPVRVRISPILDKDGRITGVVESFTSNHDRMHLTRENARLSELALIDPLTEIGNRRYLEHGLRDVFNESSRFSWPFGLMFADLDKFKQINDTYGHDVGDQALRMVARTLRMGIRSYDLVGRWGGEEFLIVIKHSSGKQIGQIAQKLCKLVESSSFETARNRVQVTISIGAVLVREGETAEELVRRADSLLRASKEAGRNRVTVDDPEHALAY